MFRKENDRLTWHWCKRTLSMRKYNHAGGYAIQRRGIMLDVVDAPYGGGVLS